MEPQSESDKRDRTPKPSDASERREPQRSGDADVATPEPPPEPFSEDDPQRADRVSALRGQEDFFLSQVGYSLGGLDGSTGAELRTFRSNATERQRWPEAAADGFSGLLRLGRPVPPRSQRIL